MTSGDEWKDYSGVEDKSEMLDYSRSVDHSKLNKNTSASTANDLSNAESQATGGNPSGSRDIGKQERNAKEPAWKTNLETKRQAAQKAIRASQTRGNFASRHKKFLIGGAVGIFGIIVPIIVIGSIISGLAQFLQIDKLLDNKLGFFSSNVVAARNFANTVVRAKAALSDSLRVAGNETQTSHFRSSSLTSFV